MSEPGLVRAIAKAAKIELTVLEESDYELRLQRILGFFDHIRKFQADLNREEPVPIGFEREDLASAPGLTSDAIEVAPRRVANLIEVPKVIESSE